MSRNHSFSPAKRRIVEHLRDNRLCATDAAAVGCKNPATLKVQVCYLRQMGYKIVAEAEDGRPWPRGAIKAWYRLAVDLHPPYEAEYEQMAKSMGVS